jgi:hypothetical protein
MIGDALRLEIEQYAAAMRTSNALYTRAAEGRLSRAHLSCYLSNVRALVGSTIPHLDRAVQRSRALGLSSLAAHYVHKAEEEVGHEAWAERDLKRLNAVRDVDLLPSMKAILAANESTIDEDPSLYLAYILFSEYLIVLLGGEWLALLEDRCGIPIAAMTVVGNHVELDRGHTEEALDHIDTLVADPRKLDRMRAVVRGAIRRFEEFSAAVVAEGDRIVAAATSRHAAVHESAA